MLEKKEKEMNGDYKNRRRKNVEEGTKRNTMVGATPFGDEGEKGSRLRRGVQKGGGTKEGKAKP